MPKKMVQSKRNRKGWAKVARFILDPIEGEFLYNNPTEREILLRLIAWSAWGDSRGIRANQILTSHTEISKRLGLTVDQSRYAIKKLLKTGFIEQRHKPSFLLFQLDLVKTGILELPVKADDIVKKRAESTDPSTPIPDPVYRPLEGRNTDPVPDPSTPIPDPVYRPLEGRNTDPVPDPPTLNPDPVYRPLGANLPDPNKHTNGNKTRDLIGEWKNLKRSVCREIDHQSTDPESRGDGDKFPTLDPRGVPTPAEHPLPSITSKDISALGPFPGAATGKSEPQTPTEEPGKITTRDIDALEPINGVESRTYKCTSKQDTPKSPDLTDLFTDPKNDKNEVFSSCKNSSIQNEVLVDDPEKSRPFHRHKKKTPYKEPPHSPPPPGVNTQDLISGISQAVSTDRKKRDMRKPQGGNFLGGEGDRVAMTEVKGEWLDRSGEPIGWLKAELVNEYGFKLGDILAVKNQIDRLGAHRELLSEAVIKYRKSFEPGREVVRAPIKVWTKLVDRMHTEYCRRSAPPT